MEVGIWAVERRRAVQNHSLLKRTYEKLLETEAGKGKMR